MKLTFQFLLNIWKVCSIAFAFCGIALGDHNEQPEGARIGVPVIGGSGCAGTSASAILSPDSKTLSILFNEYTVEAGHRVNVQVDRKSCNIVIPVGVPQGYSVSIYRVDFRGFNSLQVGTRSQFEVEYFFAGGHGPTIKRAFYGPILEDFTESHELVASTAFWSACGTSENLRINTGLLVQSDPFLSQEAKSSIDSADVTQSLVYTLAWRQCSANPPQPPLPPPPSHEYQGNCKIDADPFRPGFYFVRDMNLDLLGHVAGIETALVIARNSDLNGRCLGINGPRPPRPPIGPRPPRPPVPPPSPSPVIPVPPFPGPAHSSCVLYVNGMQFDGRGYNIGQCEANARSNCLLTFNNSRICNSGVIRF